METRQGSLSVYSLQVQLGGITKYRYQVLQGEIQQRCREIIRQCCNSLDIQIIKGVVSKDHIHLHISYSPPLLTSDCLFWVGRILFAPISLQKVNKNIQNSGYYEGKGKDILSESNDYYSFPFPANGGAKLFRSCFYPAKATVFGIEKQNQDIYNKEYLSEWIGKTILTRKFREFAGEK
jgi:REP element-mobilizing transposase RayT